MKNNPLLDARFLRDLDLDNQKEVFIKIVSLNQQEESIEQIEGRAIGGTINIDGSSAVRRTCSIQMVADGVNITDVYWGLTTKFALYIGLTNNINNNYENLIWFPQGIFLITSFNTTLATNGYKISISGKDKTCLLNGDIGGNLPNPIDFATELVEYNQESLSIDELINKYSLIENLHWKKDENGISYLTDLGNSYVADLTSEENVAEVVEVKDSLSNSVKSFKKIRLSIGYIIREMIHHYGNEPFHNILIKDVDNQGLELLKYNEGDFYTIIDKTGTYINLLFNEDLTKYKADTGIQIALKDLTADDLSTTTNLKTKFKDNLFDMDYYYIGKVNGQDAAGYRSVELYWPDDDGLVANVGDTITSILDKICKTFGEYEYFYNVYGQFVFQRKRIYVNQSWDNQIITEDSANPEEDKKFTDIYQETKGQYKYSQLYEEAAALASKSVYNFSNNVLISSFQNTPDFSNIKNNFMIWGKKQPTSSNSDGVDIHLRYAIDEKPTKYTSFEGIVYRTYDPLESGEFTKTPNPADTLIGEPLSEEWWDVKDWAELYKMYLGDYPEENLGHYYHEEDGTIINLEKLYKPCDNEKLLAKFYGSHLASGHWENWKEKKLYVFDLLTDNYIGYTGHGAWCTHPWRTWFDPLYQKGGKAYVYKPIIPSQDSEHVYYTKLNWRELIYQMALDYEKYGHNDDYAVKLAKLNPQYPYGRTGYESYYADFLAYWRDIYDPLATDSDKYYVGKGGTALPEKQQKYYGWNRAVIDDPSTLTFWIDFIEDKDSPIGKYSVRAIGDRPKVVNDEDIKAIIYRDIPNIIYISPEKYEIQKQQNLLQSGYDYFPLARVYESKFSLTTKRKSAYTELNDLLYQYAYMNEKINLKSIPVYYLEPNNIVTVDDNESNIHGDYVINKISLQLTHNGMMTVTATKAPPKLL